MDEEQTIDVTVAGHARAGSAPFPIVGIGASAGGLAATTELLRHLGAAPGVAVVIVHHLDPSSGASSLVETFAKATPLPVQAARDGLLVASNCIYVVPPNAGLLLVDGALKLTPRIEQGGLHLPIDRFFKSLAVDREADAVGVLLTGSASDGAQGIKAIKHEGGITFAQDNSAAYGSLLESAIATGCVDLVLSPAAIAAELGRLHERVSPGVQSNEELKATDEARNVRQAECARLDGELHTVLRSVEIPIVILGRDLRLRCFTPAAAKVLGLVASDLGNTMTGLSPSLHVPDFAQLIGSVLEQRSPLSRTLQTEAGHWYQLTVRPYLDLENRIDGIVLTVFDIDEVKKAEQQIRQYRDRLQRMAFDAAVAEERERRRIAADLHDRLGQSLALAQLRLTSTRGATTGPVREAIEEALNLVAKSVVHTRTLTFELSPPVLYDLGLKDALSWLVEDVEKRHGIRVVIEDDAEPKPLDDATAALVFRAVRELLMNVFKHAKTSSAKVSLRRDGEHFDITVEDRGIGFNPDDMNSQSATGGFGLFSVREQICSLGGTVQVVSLPQRGTQVSIRVRLRADALPPRPSGRR